MPEICRVAAVHGLPIYLFGATEETNRRASDCLVERFPGLQVAGRQAGYVPAERMDELVDQINRSGARILFVALGSPRQELWMHRYRNSLSQVGVCQGVGGTLDVIAGKVARAPALWRAVNAEWLYRLVREPSRIARQRRLPRFVWRLLTSGAPPTRRV
jgi:N-acetylglucosaminyldiphosphoundecaprenol N-acetyl-beta-D-mannosaminyltransferase